MWVALPVLLNNIENYVKISQTGPFRPWKWHFKVIQRNMSRHSSLVQSWRSSMPRQKLLIIFKLNCQKWVNLALSDLEKWPSERCNQSIFGQLISTILGKVHAKLQKRLFTSFGENGLKRKKGNILTFETLERFNQILLTPTHAK